MESKKKSSFHIGIVFAGPLIVGIALLAIFLYFVGFAEVIKTAGSVNPTLMLMAFVLDMAGLFLYGTCWYALLRGADLKIRLPTTISVALRNIPLLHYSKWSLYGRV